jgi:chromosome segregation ATPase
MSQTEAETPVVDAEQPSAGTSETPDVDALITELRTSLASSQTLLSSQTTRLIKLDEVEAELAQVKDQYAFALAAKEAGDARLKEETKKREVAEELAEELKAQVETLRGQVEQARRGVMTLQKQEDVDDGWIWIGFGAALGRHRGGGTALGDSDRQGE